MQPTVPDNSEEATPVDSGVAITSPVLTQDRVPVEAEYWLALSRLKGIGRVALWKLIQQYQTARQAWQHRDADWREAGIVGRTFSSDTKRAEALGWGKDQVDQLVHSSWSLIVLGDDRFPTALTHLHHPPPFLFILGNPIRTPAIAIVGARRTTDYGVRATQAIASVLAASGVTIVSGFARGIDTVAHICALEANAPTVAVWGCGPDIVYPPENKHLVERVAQDGTIVTEFPFGTAPEAQNFPIRNRLIAGLADGVLVTQARRKSGALLTAHHAIEQGKNVYAIPSEIGNEQYFGSLELLKEGARLVTSAADILADFRMTAAEPGSRAPQPLPALSDIEHRVYDELGGTPCHIDRVAVSLGLPAGECARVLVVLELKGLVRQQAGSFVTRVM
jgi:DNA processing protein